MGGRTSSSIATTSLRAFGTTVTLAVEERDELPRAEALLRDELDAVDRACSRFRPDAEIAGLCSAGGTWVTVSPLLFEAVAVACSVAEQTAGVVDPTIGSALERLGYDRDFASVPALGAPLVGPSTPAPGWWQVDLAPESWKIRVPDGVVLDLGATAKAWTADRAALRIAASTGSGVLVSIGGDVSVVGPPPDGGWPVGIAVDSSSSVESMPVVAITEGGLASSSTQVRAWRRGDRAVHHIIDPATGDCASDLWSLVSVAAANCVDANAASTAAVIWAESAPERLEALGLPARLVRRDGEVVTVAGWPPDDRAQPQRGAPERRGA